MLFEMGFVCVVGGIGDGVGGKDIGGYGVGLCWG